MFIQIFNICFKYVIIGEMFEMFFDKMITSILSDDILQILIEIVRK